MKPKARITKIKDGVMTGAYFVEFLIEFKYCNGVATNTAQKAFDYCEAHRMMPVEVKIE
jgi:hypothetical protein